MTRTVSTARYAGGKAALLMMSLALVLAAAIGVAVGAQLERFVQPSTLKVIAGIGFIAIGVWTIWSRFRA